MMVLKFRFVDLFKSFPKYGSFSLGEEDFPTFEVGEQVTISGESYRITGVTEYLDGYNYSFEENDDNNGTGERVRGDDQPSAADDGR